MKIYLEITYLEQVGSSEDFKYKNTRQKPRKECTGNIGLFQQNFRIKCVPAKFALKFAKICLPYLYPSLRKECYCIPHRQLSNPIPPCHSYFVDFDSMTGFYKIPKRQVQQPYKNRQWVLFKRINFLDHKWLLESSQGSQMPGYNVLKTLLKLFPPYFWIPLTRLNLKQRLRCKA